MVSIYLSPTLGPTHHLLLSPRIDQISYFSHTSCISSFDFDLNSSCTLILLIHVHILDFVLGAKDSKMNETCFLLQEVSYLKFKMISSPFLHAKRNPLPYFFSAMCPHFSKTLRFTTIPSIYTSWHHYLQVISLSSLRISTFFLNVSTFVCSFPSHCHHPGRLSIMSMMSVFFFNSLSYNSSTSPHLKPLPQDEIILHTMIIRWIFLKHVIFCWDAFQFLDVLWRLKTLPNFSQPYLCNLLFKPGNLHHVT